MEPQNNAPEPQMNMRAVTASVSGTTEKPELVVPEPASPQSWMDVLQSSARWYDQQSTATKQVLQLGAILTGGLLLLNSLGNKRKQDN